MSLQIRDGISPDLARKARLVSDKRPLLEAMGLQLVSITKRTFRDESLRPSPWPARKTPGDHNLLMKSGALWHSIRITDLGDSTVTVGTDRKYGALHQFGGVIQAKGKALRFQIGGKTIYAKQVKIPARPFFPFTKDGHMTQVAQQKVHAAALQKLARLLS